MSPPDPAVGLFKRRAEIDVDGEPERIARELAALGLLSIEECSFVRCVNEADPDQLDLRDRTCTGRIYLAPGRDEEDHQYHCPECDRLVFPSTKVASRALRLTPVESEIVARVDALIVAAGFEAYERPPGLFRVLDDVGMAEVCLVDRCATAAPLEAGYRTPVLFVVANDRDYLRRVPQGGEAYRLVELVLGDAGARFRRRLRELVRGAEAEGPALPAVLGLPAPLGVSDSAVAPALTGATGLQAPPGTRWNQVEFFHIDGDTLAFRVPGARARRVTFQDLGLADGRGSKRARRWDILVELCEARGQLSWTGTEREKSSFKAQVSLLRASLQAALGIHGNPLTLTAEGGLRAAFATYPYAPGERPIEDALDLDDLDDDGWSRIDRPREEKSGKSTRTRSAASPRAATTPARSAPRPR